MFSRKEVITLKPMRLREKLSNKANSNLRFYKNRFGFYTNDFLVLKDVHSIDILSIELIDIKTTKELHSTNIQNVSDKSIKYKLEWLEFIPSKHLLRVKCTNEEIKYFYARKFEDHVIWDEFENITHIVYLDENLSFSKDFSSIVELKYNSSKNQNVLFKSFKDAIEALSYILINDDISIVILTKQNMKNLSAKNLIKRVRKTRDDILFIFFSNEKNIKIEDVECFDKSNYSSLFERLDSIIK